MKSTSFFADTDEVFDLVGDMGDHLDRFAQIVAATFAFENILIDLARADRVRTAGGDTREAFVVTQIKIRLCAIIGDKDLAMFKRAHGAGIHIQIGIQLAQPDRKTSRLEQRAKGCGRKAFAQRGHHTTGDENEPCHARSAPVIGASELPERPPKHASPRDLTYTRVAPDWQWHRNMLLHVCHVPLLVVELIGPTAEREERVQTWRQRSSPAGRS